MDWQSQCPSGDSVSVLARNVTKHFPKTVEVQELQDILWSSQQWLQEVAFDHVNSKYDLMIYCLRYSTFAPLIRLPNDTEHGIDL